MKKSELKPIQQGSQTWGAAAAGVEPIGGRMRDAFNAPLRLLIVEDVEDDAELLAHELRSGGYEPEWERVETSDEMEAALQNRQWDLILADYSLPGFNATEALALARENALDLPFIIVSATIDDQTAIEAMRLGAHDYIMKDNLSRLLPTVGRELREASTRREHRRAEAALRESLQTSAEIVRAIPSGLFIYQFEPPDRLILLSVNPEAERLTGVKDEEWVGREFDAIWPGARESGVTEAFLNVVRTEKKFEVEDLQYVDDRIKGAYRTRAFPMSRGRLGVALEDVTEHRRSDEALRAALDESRRRAAEMSVLLESLENSEKRYRDLYEDAPIAYFSIAAADGSILACNAAAVELLGYDKETLMGTKIWDVYADTPNGRSKAQEVFARLIEGDLIRDVELEMENSEGENVWVSLSIEPVRDRFGRLVECRSMVMDISERKNLEAQFFRAQKMESIGTLAGGVAHDFNNLLGGILGYASFMKAKMESDHPFFRYIDTIEKSATRAAQLTSQLLGFARDGRYDTRPVNLNEVVEETLSILGSTIDKSIEINTDLLDHLPTVTADSGQIQQALLNLCVNARDAMSGGGELSVATDIETIAEDYAKDHEGAKEGSYVTLSVTDTGMGMDEETLNRIFEPFFTTKEEGKGTGLGLAMVYGVIKNHGGFVYVRSEPGAGSTFKMHLPISGMPETKEPAQSAAPIGGSELILVVDDEEPIRALTKETLESFGYRVLLAEDGRDAIGIFEERKDEISLVILDMVMPKMGGRETFVGLKEIRPDVRALLSTGYSQSGRAQEILNSGVRGFIQKPYKLNELLRTVRNTLDVGS